MNIETTNENGVVVASLKGRMDATTAPDFDSWFSARRQAGENRLIFDMTALDYISSAGLRSLLTAAKQIKASGGTIVLCGLIGTVAEVFKMSGFMNIFTVTPTSKEALSAIA